MYVDEEDPANIVRKDDTLDQEQRTFTHLSTQAEISVPAASAQYVLNQSLPNIQDVTMQSLPSANQD